MKKEIILTAEGITTFEAELTYLRTVKRQKVIETLCAASELGDLRENSEHDAAILDQVLTEMRIKELESILQNAKVVEGSIDGRIPLFL